MHKTIYSDTYRRLIAWLKACRKSRKISMRAVAKELGVAHTWVNKVEQAERRLDIAEYVRLCKVLKIDPHDGLDLLLSAEYDRSFPTKRPVNLVAESKERYHTRC